MEKRHPHPLLRGRYPRWTAPLLGSKNGGESASAKVPGTRRWSVSPQGRVGSSAEEGVLAMEEAKQPAVWGGLLDDLLDL